MTRFQSRRIVLPAFARMRRLMASASVAAIAMTAPLTAVQAQSQPFGSMVRMQTGTVIGANGQLSQWSGASGPVIGTDADGRPLMTIQQNQQKALLDWEQFRLQTNEILEFRQQSSDWIAVNRVHGTAASEILGEIRAPGKVFVFNDNGVLVGKDAKINVRQLVTGKGFSDVLVDGKTTTLVQSRAKAILDWSNMSLQAGEVLKYRQEAKDWVALNRSNAAGTTIIDGNISADGHIYLIAPKGLAINGSITAQQMVLSALNISDKQFEQNGLISTPTSRMLPTFTNSLATVAQYDYPAYAQTILNIGGTWAEASDPNDPLKYNVTIGKTGTVSARDQGKIMLFGPKVVNKGIISVVDEGQVLMVGGENIFLADRLGNGMLSAYSAPFTPLASTREAIQYYTPRTVPDAEWAAFLTEVLGRPVGVGQFLSSTDFSLLTAGTVINNLYYPGGLIGNYLVQKQYERAHAIGYTARNEGIIYAARGGNVGFHGLNLEQMGSIEMTSTAQFRGTMDFIAVVQPYGEYLDSPDFYRGTPLDGNGTIIFGPNSLTQITPDLDAKDTIAVSSGAQSVGTMTIQAGQVHMQQNAMINMPSGTIKGVLDASYYVFSNRGNFGNRGNEDGSRFMMESGATIDLSGWKQTVLDMGYHQVTGRLFAAELADSPVQRDGPLYRKEISVDRRFGTDFANWQNFDNLNQGTLAQFLVNGGTFTLDVGDDFIMKPGSIIDVSGGITTYSAGFVKTTLVRRLDGTVIDIRAADPDELYMGLANEWVQYDTKWGKQQSYYIPLLSSSRGQYETSYVEGGKGGLIQILAPDVLLQGVMKGETVAGRYQRGNTPAGGVFTLNYIDGEDVLSSENEYISNRLLITNTLPALMASFGLNSRLTDIYGDLFGDEFDRETDPLASETIRSDNATVVSTGFLNNSTMGSYAFYQRGAIASGLPINGFAAYVGADVQLNLRNGGSLTIGAQQRLGFDGSIRTEGGRISLSGMALAFSDRSRIDTRGSWYSDFELSDAVPLAGTPRFDGGSVYLSAGAEGTLAGLPDMGLILPKGMVIDTSGGGWVDRNGILTPGIAGDLFVAASFPYLGDPIDLSAAFSARAYGLAGNGALILNLSDPVFIGLGAIPPTPGERTPILLNPGFFENSGFSTIGIIAPGISLLDGQKIEASSASLVLRDATLVNGMPAAYAATTGTDIYDIADVRNLPPEQRPLDTLAGMNIAFVSGDYNNYIGEGSSITTQIGGKIELVGNTYVAGTLTAPSGQIWLGGASAAGSFRYDGLNRNGAIWVPQDTQQEYTVYVGPRAQLLAPGSSLVLSQGVGSNGQAIRDGRVFGGGLISIIADRVLLDRGAVLSVAGISERFDRALSGGAGILTPTDVASNGGIIRIQGLELAIDRPTYMAAAGGAGAVGGSFELAWRPRYGAAATDPTVMVDTLEGYFSAGYLYGFDGQPILNLYGVDLSTVDWLYSAGADVQFTPGFTLQDRAALFKLFADYDAASAGAPPVLLIGDRIDLSDVTPIEADFPTALAGVFNAIFGFTLPPANTAPPIVTYLSPERIEQAGFSSLNIDASAGIVFNGDVSLGGKRADGSYLFDTLRLNALSFMGRPGADVTLEAGYVQLLTPGGNTLDIYKRNIAAVGVNAVSANTGITVKAGTLLSVASADFYGFSTIDLVSAGDIRFSGFFNGGANPTGSLHASGLLRFTADQIYAGSGRIFSVSSDTGIEILPQNDGGRINASPYEAAAELTFTAPSIVQSGIVRSPLGTLNFNAYDNGTVGSGAVTMTAGSITSVSSEGRLIPYGFTSNGDTWINPFTGEEMKTLSSKAINIKAGTVDFQEGSKLDITGGGDLMAREFVQGTGGTYDWLRGYRDAAYNWIPDASGIYAVLPGFDGDIAPLSFGGSSIPVGAKVYLPGGSGLAAGYYVLLPAEYALLPGAFRVTANHRQTDAFGMAIGEVRVLSDASSIQAGYQVSGITGQATTGSLPFLVMPGATLRKRSSYIETSANGYFSSEAYLKKAARINRDLLDLPRRPLDGGSLSLTIGSTLQIDGTLFSGAGKGGRDGLFDISAPRIVVGSSSTNAANYAGYLMLDSDQLSGFGAESILIGGTRASGNDGLELLIGTTDLVIDNAGSALKAPDIILAATGRLDVLAGAAVEATGQIDGTAGDLHLAPLYSAVTFNNRTPDNLIDDVLVHGALDTGALIHLSTAQQVDIVRNQAAVDAYAQLTRDPTALAAVNAQRLSMGLAPISGSGGLLTIADGSRLIGGQSLALDATDNVIAPPGAVLQARQISASSSRISIGAVPSGTQGLVFNAASLLSLGSAQELTLKSYSSIDLFGSVDVRAADALRLDTRELRLVGGIDQVASINAKTLTLTNSQNSAAVATAGAGTLTLSGANVRLEGGEKALSGVQHLVINAEQRLIGSGNGVLHVPGSISISAGAVSADNGQRLAIDATGAIAVGFNGAQTLPVFDGVGGTVALSGSAIDFDGHIRMIGGQVNMTARDGDLRLRENARIDVTSGVATFFDVSVGVAAGIVNLTAARGDIALAQGSLIDVSGLGKGGDAGTLNLAAGLGAVQVGGTLKGQAGAEALGGRFSLFTGTLSDFGAFDAQIAAAGFNQDRRYEVNAGDVTIASTIRAQNFTLLANAGTVTLTGTIETTGDNGGRVQLAAAGDVTLTGTGRILAGAKAVGGSGGTVVLETAGAGGGVLSVAAGAVVDVSGQGEGGRTIRLRAPQLGNGDVAIGSVAGSFTGARSVTAEAYRVYDNVATIDQPLIDLVSADAASFFAANGAAIQTRLGAQLSLIAGIEMRNTGDMQLATDWDLAGLRFNGVAGALTLRAAGDLRIDANLSDGFVGTQLLNGDSWSFNLTAGANLASPNSMATLPADLLAAGKGSIFIGGKADTVEYFYDPAYGNENRLYLRNTSGGFARDSAAEPYNYHLGFIELQRDAATGKYIDPTTGALIEKDPVTGDYTDTTRYARRPLPWLLFDSGGSYQQQAQDGSILGPSDINERDLATVRPVSQWNNATGYKVRTGTGAIGLSAARDLVLEQRPSVVYTAGRAADVLSGFFAPPEAVYGKAGGDIRVEVGRDILADPRTPQLPIGYLRQSARLDTQQNMFAVGEDRPFAQSTWWIDHDDFEGGLGALGGGNIDIAARGNVRNLGIAIPTTGRVTGGTVTGEPLELHTLGGGNLTLIAGGDIAGGAFYVGDGLGMIVAGGALTAGSKVHEYNYTCEGMGSTSFSGCNIHYDPVGRDVTYDLYPMLFTSAGHFSVRAAGDLNVEGVFDPLLLGSGTPLNTAAEASPTWQERQDLISFTPDASLELFSSGGNVTMWNNDLNIRVAYFQSVPHQLQYLTTDTKIEGRASSGRWASLGGKSIGWELRPATISAIAAAGDVSIYGGIVMMPSATGNLDLLAAKSVYLGYETEARADVSSEPFPVGIGNHQLNQRTSINELGIFMSQSDLSLLPTPDNIGSNVYLTLKRENFMYAGGGNIQPGGSYFTPNNFPDLHMGDKRPARIYAAQGDFVSDNLAILNLPKQTWIQAGGSVYFPSFTFQHNQATDLSLVRAGDGVYFSQVLTQYLASRFTNVSYGYLSVFGPGRLEVEAGGDIYLPSNSLGITSDRIQLYPVNMTSFRTPTIPWHPNENAADISISAGFNQKPSYAAFEAAYLDPSKADGQIDYVIDETSGKSLYLFDRDYPRAEGATGEFATPEPREGLVNYVRRLQGLAPLATREAEQGYLDAAWSYWQGLSNDYKTPFFRSVLFLEMRTSGREANDPKNDRFGSAERGYTAIQTLFPGAQKAASEALVAGESRWNGDFETYASRVISFGGGKVELVIPGGKLDMANVVATNDQTGQPSLANPRGDAMRAGIITADGGEVNILAHNSVILNNSRLLTTKGGNVMIWSSFGDIAAGKGAKTSISPQYYDYLLDQWAALTREPAGLPTGAGIGTLATQPGVPPADVDLVAPLGIVDAGDAGIRVSGNLNVFAVQVLGLDNIQVAGIATGLPVPPAAPPTALDVGNVAAKANFIDKALDDAVARVQANNAVLSPSLIQVRVTGFDIDGCDGCGDSGRDLVPGAAETKRPAAAPVGQPEARPLSFERREVDFDIPPQPLDDAIRAIAKASGFNILFEATDIVISAIPRVQGRMTPEDALRSLVADQGLTVSRIGPRTIVLGNPAR